MNYQKIYDQLMSRAMHRSLECYTERHHIIPKCMGGGDDPSNIAILTPEEHYVSHQLLVKIHPSNQKLVFAAHMMTVSNHSSVKRNNKTYGWLRRRLAAALRINNKGQVVTPEQRAKISAAGKGRVVSSETRRRISVALTGKQRSQEHSANISKALTGRKLTAETRQKMSAAHAGQSTAKGYKWTEAQRAALSVARMGNSNAKGSKRSVEQRKKMSDVMREIHRKRRQIIAIANTIDDEAVNV